MINKTIPTYSIEEKKNIFRLYRKRYLQTFDLWEKAVIRGRETDSTEVMNWYQMMLDYTNTIDEETDINDFPKLHPKLEKYRH